MLSNKLTVLYTKGGDDPPYVAFMKADMIKGHWCYKVVETLSGLKAAKAYELVGGKAEITEEEYNDILKQLEDFENE